MTEQFPIYTRIRGREIQIGWISQGGARSWDPIVELPLREVAEAMELAYKNRGGDPVKEADLRIGFWQRVRWVLTRGDRKAKAA